MRFLTVLAFRDTRLCHWCPRDRWVYGIHPDAEWPQLHRRRARERYDAALASTVHRGSRLRDLREDRAVEQDRAVSLCLHLGRLGLEAEERSLQVGRDHPIESRFVNGIQQQSAAADSCVIERAVEASPSRDDMCDRV